MALQRLFQKPLGRKAQARPWVSAFQGDRGGQQRSALQWLTPWQCSEQEGTAMSNSVQHLKGGAGGGEDASPAEECQTACSKSFLTRQRFPH